MGYRRFSVANWLENLYNMNGYSLDTFFLIGDVVMGYRVLSQYRSELMGFAMLWVMLFHSFDLDLGLPLLNGIRRAGFGGVDIFILLSAMGLVVSLLKEEQEYAAFMARRAGRILPAYFVVMLPYTLLLILTQDAPWSALFFNSTLLYYWVRCAGAFNWYIAGAMTFYAVTPFCFRRWRASRHRTRLTAGCVAGAFALCQLLISDGYWNYMDIFYRVPIFFVGLLMGFYVREDRKIGGTDLLFWVCWLVLGCIYLPVSILKEWDAWPVKFPLCLLFLFTTVPMCLVICFCFERLPLGWLRRFLRKIGDTSLEIYLLNVSFFSQTELLRRFLSFGPTNRLYYLIIYILNIALGLLLHKLVEGLRARRHLAAR